MPPPSEEGQSVTHVSGINCYPSLRKHTRRRLAAHPQFSCSPPLAFARREPHRVLPGATISAGSEGAAILRKAWHLFGEAPARRKSNQRSRSMRRREDWVRYALTPAPTFGTPATRARAHQPTHLPVQSRREVLSDCLAEGSGLVALRGSQVPAPLAQLRRTARPVPAVRGAADGSENETRAASLHHRQSRGHRLPVETAAARPTGSARCRGRIQESAPETGANSRGHPSAGRCRGLR